MSIQRLIIAVLIACYGLTLVESEKPVESDPGIFGDAWKVMSAMGCVAKLTVPAFQCAKEGSDDWKDVDDPRKYCCEEIDMSYCMMSKVKEKCSADDYRSYVDFMYGKLDKLVDEDKCSSYGHRWYDYKSWKCHIPWVGIAIVCGLIVFLIVLFVVMGVMFKK